MFCTRKGRKCSYKREWVYSDQHVKLLCVCQHDGDAAADSEWIQ